jgi:hypothetical protein
MSVLKQKARRYVNSILEPCGFQLIRFRPELQSRSMFTSAILTSQSERFLGQITSALTPLGLGANGSISVEAIAAFSRELSHCPVKQQAGGGGHNVALLLWTVIQCIQPEEIIESGVFKGFTTWVMRKAAPSARIRSFDISFAELKWRDGKTEYHEMDWTKVIPRMHGKRVRRAAFFDDHQSQWRRIRESMERGIEFVVFDDSYPTGCVHADANAACPTVDMLFDEALEDGQEIAWKTECGTFRYRFDLAEAQATRQLVSSWVRLPDLQMTFGYKPANLVVVKLIRQSNSFETNHGL